MIDAVADVNSLPDALSLLFLAARHNAASWKGLGNTLQIHTQRGGTHITKWFIPPIFCIISPDNRCSLAFDRAKWHTHKIKACKPDRKTWVAKWERQQRGAEGGKRDSATEGINVSLLTVSTTNHPLWGNNSDTWCLQQSTRSIPPGSPRVLLVSWTMERTTAFVMKRLRWNENARVTNCFILKIYKWRICLGTRKRELKEKQ